MVFNVLNFGRFIFSALAVIELSSLLQRFLFSIRYLSLRVFCYFKLNMCHGFWKPPLSQFGLEVLIYNCISLLLGI